ncbi:aminomethyl transferase family protein [Agrobacterium fabrum]|uniref:aminomethyl transferase family protein n=1 Tax=Agrobacterium fabrum TaxID=1176649 RepID=UPI0021D2F5BD|nr:aminomethyl transferase family protein [Agrobacterium fabrum]
MNSTARLVTLQNLLDSKENIADYFYHETLAPHVKDRGGLTPVPAEFTNWFEEQRAWRESAILFDQSHHMPELFLKGPDAFRLLNYIGINSFENFKPGKAKQFVGCNHQGQIIGECVVYYHEDESFELISGMHLLNWVQYNIETGGYDVTFERDQPTYMNPNGRRKFRFGMDGPNAEKIFREGIEKGAPEIPFFNFASVKIAGIDVHALRHGMAGHKGVELSGPYEHMETVRAAILKAGEKYGLRRGGTTTYFSAIAESGWMPYPLPAIYTSEELRPYREWLPASSWEANSQLGGSFYSDNLEDYYVTPYDMGYDRIIKFDHDFIGRAALERLSGNSSRRTNVTLVWNKDDVATIFASLVGTGPVFKHLKLPMASYSFQQNDEVRNLKGELVGLSNFCGYSANEKEILSLAIIDIEHAAPGTEVTLVWGEPDGGSRKPHVEPHTQMTVRAIVAPAPYSKSVQAMKRSSL